MPLALTLRAASQYRPEREATRAYAIDRGPWSNEAIRRLHFLSYKVLANGNIYLRNKVCNQRSVVV